MKKRVLVVDDSEFARTYHSSVLRGAGYDVSTAEDGAEGLDQLFRESFDIVLTDINMEPMDGYEFIRRVRAEAGLEDIPIVVISTEGDAPDRQKGFEAGANLYVEKPYEPEVLLETLQVLC